MFYKHFFLFEFGWWCLKHLWCDEKILKIMVRAYAACGGEGSNCASVAIRTVSVCVRKPWLAVPFGWHVEFMLHLSSTWRQNFWTKSNFENFGIISVHKEVNIDALVCVALLSWLLPEFSNMSWLERIHEQICSLSISSLKHTKLDRIID